MFTTVEIINYLYSMRNCFVKASQNYKKVTNMSWKVMWISTLSREWIKSSDGEKPQHRRMTLRLKEGT